MNNKRQLLGQLKGKMPESAQRKKNPMLEFDESEFELEGEPMEEGGEIEMDAENAPGPLADFSDEELMAEINARGLNMSAPGEDKPAPSSDSEEEELY